MTEKNNQPKHRWLAEKLRLQIASGQWSTGESLPSESQLAEANNASRGTIRQALSTLRHEGLISGGQGKPPVVAQAVSSQSFSTFMSFTEWAHHVGKVPGQRTLELAKRPADAHIASQLEIAEGQNIVQILRLRLLDGAPAMVERTSFIHSVGRMLFEFDTDSGSIFSYLRDQGTYLERASHTIDAVGADEQDEVLLQIERGAALLRERRITFGIAHLPIEYSDDRYLPAQANFTIENTSEHRAALRRTSALAGH